MNSLDVSSYSKQELIELLKLPENYNQEHVNKQCQTMKANLEKNIMISGDQKKNYITFLDQASDILSKDMRVYSNYMTPENLPASEVTSAGQSFFIQKDRSPYHLTYSQVDFPGDLNPLQKRILVKNLNIDSKFRENYFSSLSTDYLIELPMRFKTIISMQVTAIEIPNAFHAIANTYGNNYFWVKVNGLRILIDIPDGTYSPLSLITYINTYLKNRAQENSDYYLFQFILFTFDVNDPGTDEVGGTFKCIVSINSNYDGDDPIQFELDFMTDRVGIEDKNTPLPLKLGWMLGFRLGYYLNNQNYVSEGSINTGGPRYFYLVVDDFNSSVDDLYYGAFTSSFLQKNILARIGFFKNEFVLSTSSALSIINTKREYFGPVTIQKLKIQLLDEFGRIVDLNNMDFSFVLSMEYVYNI